MTSRMRIFNFTWEASLQVPRQNWVGLWRSNWMKPSTICLSKILRLGFWTWQVPWPGLARPKRRQFRVLQKVKRAAIEQDKSNTFYHERHSENSKSDKSLQSILKRRNAFLRKQDFKGGYAFVKEGPQLVSISKDAKGGQRRHVERS